MASLKAFKVGAVVNKVQFDTTKSIESIVAILETFTYDDETGLVNLIDTVGTMEDNGVLYAYKNADVEGAYAITLATTNSTNAIVVWASGADEEQGVVAGFQNLGEDGTKVVNWKVASLAESGWNGVIVGNDYTDTVVAGTYNFTNNSWSDTASYSVTETSGTYAVSGQIPYGSANSLFPTAGYRCAVKISRSSITSSSELPTGNILVITNTEDENNPFVYTSSGFESDGSLIVIFAPTADTLSTSRQVKIAWGIEGDTVADTDFTTYTFDLSDATLAPIPEVITTDECIGYCITPNIQSDKLVKVLVPEGGLYAGQLVNVIQLVSEIDTIGNNLEIYVATQPTDSTVDSEFIALVTNGKVEELADGRRPDGQPDYTKYHYSAGEIADAVLLDKNLVFEVGCSVVSGGNPLNVANDIGKYIVPVGGTYNGAVYATPTNGGCMKILGTHYFRCGKEFKPTYIARAHR